MRRSIADFLAQDDGASAVEFAIVLAPFVFLLLGLAQMGVYYYAQISLDAGVLKTAEYLNTDFRTGSGTAANQKRTVDQNKTAEVNHHLRRFMDSLVTVT